MASVRARVRGRVLAVGTVVAALLVTAACTAEPASPRSETRPSPRAPSASATATGTRTLTFGLDGPTEVRRALRAVVADFAATRPGLTVRFRPFDAADATVPGPPTASGTGPSRRSEAAAPDVYVAGADDTPALAEADAVIPLDRRLARRDTVLGESYQRLGLAGFGAEQRLQCMAFNVSPLVVFHNPDLVDLTAVALPDEDPVTAVDGWTWEQFERAARRVTGRGVAGLHLDASLVSLLALVRSAGTELVDDPRDPTTLTLSENPTREALVDVLSVVRDSDLTLTAQQLERRGPVARFTDGRLALLVGTRALVPRLRAAGVDFDVLPLPRLARARTSVRVSGLCAAAGSGRVAEAADLIAYATGPQGAPSLAESGAVVPAHLPTLASTSFLQPGRAPEHARVFSASLATGGLDPFDPGWARLRRAVDGEVDAMFYDSVINLDRVLPRLDRLSRRYLAGGGDPSEVPGSPGSPGSPG